MAFLEILLTKLNLIFFNQTLRRIQIDNLKIVGLLLFTYIFVFVFDLLTSSQVTNAPCGVGTFSSRDSRSQNFALVSFFQK